jgi:hypothetical protein
MQCIAQTMTGCKLRVYHMASRITVPCASDEYQPTDQAAKLSYVNVRHHLLDRDLRNTRLFFPKYETNYSMRVIIIDRYLFQSSVLVPIECILSSIVLIRKTIMHNF